MLTVTQVDDQDGHLRVHMKATNDTDAVVRLPLAGYFRANDDTGRTCRPEPCDSDWNGVVRPGQSISGRVALVERRKLPANRLAVSFTSLGSQAAPDGDLTVHGILLP